MLDAPAPIVGAAEHFRIYIEQQLVGAVADAVRVHLEVVRLAPRGHLGEMFARGELQTMMSVLVVVGRLQQGTARPEGAIGVHLHTAHLQPFIGDGTVPGEVGQVRAVAGHHGIDAHLERAFLLHAPDQCDAARVEPGIAHHGEACGETVALRIEQGLPLGGLVGLIEDALEHRHGIVHQQSGEPAVAPYHQAAFDRSRGVQPHAVHGRLVHHRGVAVNALQQYGAVGEQGVQRGIVGIFLHVPEVLVPAAAHDPLLLRMGVGEGFDPAQHLVPSARAVQVHLLLVEPIAQEVAMAIDEAWVDPSPLRIVLLLRPVLVQDLPFGAELHDATIAHGHGLEGAARLVHGVDHGVVHDQVGLLRPVATDEQDKGGEQQGSHAEMKGRKRGQRASNRWWSSTSNGTMKRKGSIGVR
jgi:hypothetical protein